MTTEQKRYVKTGILFIIIIIMSIWGVNYIRSNDLLSGQIKLYGVYDDVKELSEGNSVFLNGTKIGKIYKVDFLDGNLNKLVVEFHIRNDIKIPDSSIAMITSIDIMGTMGLKILINKKSKTYYKSGDTLSTRVENSLSEEVNKQILPLKIKTENMIGTLDSLLVAFRSVFNPKTRINIKKSFEHIQITLRNLESTTSTLDTLMTTEKARIAKIINNAESITNNLKANNDNINKILSNFGDISDSLSASGFVNIIHNADSAIYKLNTVLNKIAEGKGSLGLLIHDDKLYYELKNASSDLDDLLLDIKNNPKRYVRFSAFDFGKKIIINQTDSIPKDE
ncbi:MAG: MlaD family protein [Bacteroidales bacterium]|nr:MlaD family protein [Bacteroidales bacterium]